MREWQQATPISTDWSKNGAYIVYHAATPKSGFDLWALSLSDGKVTSLSQTLANELDGSISQDSRWLAYASDESGRYEVYVQAFPKPKDKDRRTISTTGGSQSMESQRSRTAVPATGRDTHVGTDRDRALLRHQRHSGAPLQDGVVGRRSLAPGLRSERRWKANSHQHASQ